MMILPLVWFSIVKQKFKKIGQKCKLFEKNFTKINSVKISF